MAKLRDIVPEPEPEDSISSGEEDDDDEEDSSAEEGDSEEERPANRSRTQPATPQKSAKPPSSSSEEGDESDTDSDSPNSKPDWNVKPIVSNPVTDDPQKSSSSLKKPRSKPGQTGLTSPRKSAVEKRPAAEKENEAKEAKRPKKAGDSVTEGGENSEKKLFQRLWSEEDEIVILKGMMDYATKKKADPVADIGAFLEFIKKSLHVEVTKTQLQDKVRRLRKKFENNVSKEKERKERTFSKPHEQTAYELSKKIWGKMLSENGDFSKEKVLQTHKAEPGSVVRKSRSKSAMAITPKKTQDEGYEVMKDLEMEDNAEGLVTGERVLCQGSQDGLASYVSMAAWVMGDGMKMVGDSKRDEMEEKWREVREKELEVFLRKTELMCEQAGMVLEAMRKPK